jgi:DNA-binding GntR family transcriptional regulator
VVDVLYEELRHQILIGEERPGSVLTEVSLANRYAVARPTAKAAVERLVADGLVVRLRRGAGASVRLLTAADVEDLYETRILVESAVNSRLARHAAEVTEAQIANDQLIAAAEEERATGIVSADVAFHKALVAQVGGVRLTRLHDQLMGEAHFCMAQVQELQLLSARQIASEHAEILAAVRGGDEQGAIAITIAHLDRARNRLLGHIAVTSDDQPPFA